MPVAKQKAIYLGATSKIFLNGLIRPFSAVVSQPFLYQLAFRRTISQAL